MRTTVQMPTMESMIELYMCGIHIMKVVIEFAKMKTSAMGAAALTST